MLFEFILTINGTIGAYLYRCCMYIYVHVCVCRDGCRGQRLTSFHLQWLSISFYEGDSESAACHSAGLLASKLQRSPPALRLQAHTLHPAFMLWFWELNPDLQACRFSLAWDTHCSEALEELFTVIDLGAWITTLLKTMDVLQTGGMGITYPPPAPVTWQGFKISKEPYTRP